MEHGWFYLGPCATSSTKKTGLGLIVKEVVPGTLADITKWKLIWNNAGAWNANSYSIWRGIPPSPDYIVLGDFFLRSDGPPTPEECNGMKAIHRDACAMATIGPQIWKDAGTGATQNITIWEISNGNNRELLLSGAFIAATKENKSERTVFALNAEKVLQRTA